MIELKDDQLRFSFPDLHDKAKLSIEFQRTLRIPDDGKEYPLPPGLDRFSLRHVDDFARFVPPSWVKHGGVMFPMYQAEAMWLKFQSDTGYPFAVRIATGKICVVSGAKWTDELQQNGRTDKQNYVVAPYQPWLDGYAVKQNVVRQFVAMPLGSGYSAEEQITGAAVFGGIQIQVYPMKREEYRERFERPVQSADANVLFQESPPEDGTSRHGSPGMGIGPGGRIQQQVYEDRYPLEVWDTENSSRCFVHIANSEQWRDITGFIPPQPPLSAREYAVAKLPWFSLYDEQRPALRGTRRLRGLKSVANLFRHKTGEVLPDNETVTPERVEELRAGLDEHEVREG